MHISIQASLQPRAIAVNPQPYARPPSLAIIPYTPPVSAQEFIDSEIKRGIATGVFKIEQLYQQKPSDVPSLGSSTLERLTKSKEQFEELFGPINIDMETIVQTAMVAQVKFDLIDNLFFSPLPDLIPSNRLEEVTRQMRQLNGDEIVEIFQGEAAFTTATEKKPVLATYACASCVGVGGFDPINHIAFLAHFSMKQEVHPSGQKVFDVLTCLAKKPFEKPTQLHLRTSEGNCECVQETIHAVKKWMASNPLIPMELASEILICDSSSDKNSLMIDARTGVVTTYHPSENSKRRQITPLDFERIRSQAYEHVLGSNQGVDIVYQPEIEKSKIISSSPSEEEIAFFREEQVKVDPPRGSFLKVGLSLPH